MSDLTIFDASGKSHSAMLVDGFPEIRLDGYSFPVFPFQVRIKNKFNTICYWILEGELHRLVGPAVEYASGDKKWYIGGKCHRLSGPAREYANGDKDWFVDGKLHRLDGPAIEYADGRREWYVEGKYLTEEEFNDRVGKL